VTSTSPRVVLAWLTPLVFVLMWSSGAIAVKFGLQDSGVATFLFLRALGAAVVSWAVWWWVRDELPHGRSDWLKTATVALLLQVGYQGFFFLALSTHVAAGLLAVIVGFQPVLTALLTRPSRDWILWTGLVGGFLGVVLTVSSSLDTGSADVLGIATAICALVAITLGTLVQSSLHGVGTWASLSLQTTLSTLVLAGMAGVSGSLALPREVSFVFPLGWMVLVISVGATALLYVMVRQRAVVRVSSLFYCVPPVTAGLDYLFFGTVLSGWELAGMLLVVISVAMIQLPAATIAQRASRQPKPTQPDTFMR
jgi:drug/metabolite transporter (DMT)-like permease